MRRVRKTDTKPGRAVRSAVHALGFIAASGDLVRNPARQTVSRRNHRRVVPSRRAGGCGRHGKDLLSKFDGVTRHAGEPACAQGRQSCGEAHYRGVAGNWIPASLYTGLISLHVRNSAIIARSVDLLLHRRHGYELSNGNPLCEPARLERSVR